MKREEALELQVVMRTLKDVHVSERGAFDSTAEALAKAEHHFEMLALAGAEEEDPD